MENDFRSHPAELYVPMGAPEGVYLVQKVGRRFEQFLRLVDGTNTVVTLDETACEVQVDASTATGVLSVVPGDGVTVDATDTAHPVVAATRREVLMADGVTSPPIPIETEAGDDWLYQD